MRRFLNQPLAIGSEITLEDEDYNYIARVLRSREGDAITLFNGEGGEYHGIITEIAKRHLTVKLRKYNPIDRISSVEIHLIQSLAKGEKMELVLQKSTELGVTSITPLATERSVMHLKKDQTEKRVERWNNIITSACEQCGLNIPPTLHEPITLEKWAQEVLPHLDTTLITLAPTAKHSLGSFLKTLKMCEEMPDEAEADLPQVAVFSCIDEEPILLEPYHDIESESEAELEERILEIQAQAKNDEALEAAEASLLKPRSITIIIGPEGGLSDFEIDLLQKSGANSVTLGARILRTETAALSVISTIQGLIGDWSEETDMHDEDPFDDEP